MSDSSYPDDVPFISHYDTCNTDTPVETETPFSEEKQYYPQSPYEPSEPTVPITGKVIEREFQSFLAYFNPELLPDCVPILVFPLNLGKLICKCIRYYAAICDFAAFYIEIQGVKILAACHSNFLNLRYLNHYKTTFLSLPEDCEHISVRHLYKCIAKNKTRNKLRRSLSIELDQYDLMSEDSDNRPFAFLSQRELESSRASITERDEQDAKDDLVRKSSLNINAQEFVPQSLLDNLEAPEDNDWIIPETIPMVYWFLPMFSANTGKDVTSHLFKDYAYSAKNFTFGSNESTQILLGRPKSPKGNAGSTEENANDSVRDNATYFLMRPLEQHERDSFKSSEELVPKAEPDNRKTHSESELTSTTSAISLPSSPPVYPSGRSLATRSPLYYTSTPNPDSSLTHENVPPFNVSDLPSTSASTRSSTLPFLTPIIASVEQPSSSRSVADGSTTQFDSTSPSSCIMLFSNVNLNPTSSSSELVAHSRSSTSQTATFETAEIPASPHFIATSPSLPENSIDQVLALYPAESELIDFETPLAPMRSAPELQVVTVARRDSCDTSNIESALSSSNSPVKSITTTTGNLGELSSSPSITSEQIQATFMGGPKNYVDYIIEYKCFLEQASVYIGGNPLLVKSSSSVNDFQYLIDKENHIIELYNIPDTYKDLDILHIYREKPRCIIWCDNSHALLVSQSPAQARRALALTHAYIRSRPIADASAVATVIACSYDLEPMFESLDRWVEEN